MTQQDLQFHAVLITDSRGRGFPVFDQGEDLGYTPHYIIKPGAKIRDLQDDAIALIGGLPKTKTKVIVKIAAGINNLTEKINHQRSYEIKPSAASANNILAELVNLKRKIKEVRPDSYVSYMTIPPVNFLQQLTHWEGTRRPAQPTFDEDKRREFQRQHELKINDINSNINALNHALQNNIRCQTASWHSVVLRRQKGRNRLIVSALADGIHGTESTKRKWHESFRQSIEKEMGIIKGYPLKLNTFSQR